MGPSKWKRERGRGETDGGLRRTRLLRHCWLGRRSHRALSRGELQPLDVGKVSAPPAPRWPHWWATGGLLAAKLTTQWGRSESGPPEGFAAHAGLETPCVSSGLSVAVCFRPRSRLQRLLLLESCGFPAFPCFSSLGHICFPSDLSFLMALKRIVDFQSVQPFSCAWSGDFWAFPM